jgi:hypothetical protein
LLKSISYKPKNFDPYNGKKWQHTNI